MASTKRELEKELSLTRNTMEKQKVQLVLCKNEREKAVLEIDALKEEQARMILNVREGTSFEGKEEIKRLKTMLSSLKKKLAKSESMNVSPEPGSVGDIPSPKSSFQIEIWKPNGHYRSVIEHRQSNRKKRWIEVNEDTLMGGINHFVSEHLPTSNEKEKLTPEAEKTSKRLEGQKEKRKPAISTHTRLASSRVLARIDLNFLNGMIYSGKNFQVELNFGLGESPEQEQDLRYKIAVYAHRLGASTQQLIDKFDGRIRSKDELSRCVNAKILEGGTYRLQAALTASLPGGTPVDTAFVRSSLFQVI